jgi:hypothetical protein
MHKNAMKCNETLSKWCKNKHGASKIIDTLETYQDAYALAAHLTICWAVFVGRASIAHLACVSRFAANTATIA